MTEKEARKLKVGDRVYWGNDPRDQGLIVEVGKNGVNIRWENGQEGWIMFKDMIRVTKIEIM